MGYTCIYICIYISLLKILAVTFESQIFFMVYLANNSQESIRSSNFHASFPSYIYLKQFCLLIGPRATCQARNTNIWFNSAKQLVNFE